MSLADLTVEAVRQAITEYDRLGQDSFLSTYGFGKARGYLLIYNGQPYDSKAIAGVAHGFLPGRVALKSNEFSGGENAAAGRLRELGFDIKGPDEQIVPVPTYEPGGIYNRVRDIHDVYGGQRQGGISTPKSAPLIFHFTGESGDQYGYHDGLRSDGTFAYTGEGQIGDMEFVRGNLAVRDHIADGRDLLLFAKLNQPGSYRFVGQFACDDFEYGAATDRAGALRQVIIFLLRPAVSGEEPEIKQAVARLQAATLDGLLVPVREGARRQHRTLLELVVLTQCQRAIKGDERAAQAVIINAKLLGVFDDERDFEWTQEDFAHMSEQTMQELENAHEARARRLGIRFP